MSEEVVTTSTPEPTQKVYADNAKSLRISEKPQKQKTQRIIPRYGGLGPTEPVQEGPTKPGRAIYSNRAEGRIDRMPETWRLLGQRFKRNLESSNRSPGTIDSYLEALQRLTCWLDDHNAPGADDPELVSGEHIETYFAELIKQGASPNTARLRFASLRVFFKWAVKVREISPNPMRGLEAPQPVAVIKPVYALEDIQQMLDHCGDDFTGRRDKAAIMVLFDCGLRASEFLSLTLDDVDLATGQLIVHHSKTNAPRWVGFADETATLLSRYLRLRRKQATTSKALWTTVGGKALGMEGLRSLVERHGGVGLHVFRHSSATAAAANHLDELHMLRTYGWTSIQMAKRYTESRGAELAAEAKRRVSPGRGLKV